MPAPFCLGWGFQFYIIRSIIFENALMFKPFSTSTVETFGKNMEAMMRNIDGIARGLPFSKMEL
jgi:hypothetical protein